MHNQLIRISLILLFAALLGGIVVTGLPGVELVIPFVIGIIAVSVIAGFGEKGEYDFFELKRAVSLVVLLIFSISTIFRILLGDYFGYSQETLVKAELISLVGFISYLFGYRIVSKQTVNFRFKNALLKIGKPTNSSLLVLGFLILTGQLMAIITKRYSTANPGVSAGPWDNIINIILTFGIVLLFVFALRYKASRLKYRYLLRSGLVVLFLSNLSLGLISGWKGSVLLVLLIPFIAFYYTTKKFPIKPFIIVIIIFIFVVYPLMSLYRGLSIFNPNLSNVAPSLTESMDAWQFVMQNKNIAFGAGEGISSMLLFRLDMIEPLTRLIDFTRIPDGLLYGKTLSLFFISLFVPRLLWAEKPDIDIGKWFGYEYGYTNYFGQSSIAMTIFGEFYLNFWWIGLIIGMGLIGFLHGFIYKSLSPYKDGDELHKSLYILCMLTTANVQGSFAVQYAGLFKQFLIWIIIWYAFVKFAPQKNHKMENTNTIKAAL